MKRGKAGRGGSRRGAGAPRGNINAIKSGNYSRQLYDLLERRTQEIEDCYYQGKPFVKRSQGDIAEDYHRFISMCAEWQRIVHHREAQAELRAER